MVKKTEPEQNPIETSTHFLTGSVDGMSVEPIIKWIIHANMNKLEGKLTLHINSEGGELSDAFGLIDVMKSSKIPISTIGIGNIMSSAFLILGAGTKGDRWVGKNTSIMIHQFSHEIIGKYHDMKSYNREIENTNDRMTRILSECSNLTEKEVKSKFLKPTDIWMTAEELIQFGVVDHIF